jgi:hypothetical protein
MRKRYDFSQMQGRKNPFAKQLKQPVTERTDSATVDAETKPLKPRRPKGVTP